MMSDDESALMRAILANPDDNHTRLVYADWLDENGTTDQHRAKSEWIRLVCWDTSKQAGKPTGKRFRLKGEPAWLRKNAHRLWPNLFALKADWWQPPVSKSLLTGRVVLSIPLSIPLKEAEKAGHTIEHARVGIQCERGITTAISVTFLRAATVGPSAAKDEPLAEITFGGLPERCYEFGNGVVYIHRRPFKLRGLADVWQRIEGGTHALVDDHEKAWEFPQENVVFSTKWLEPAIDKALTGWARKQADNPLVMGEAA